MIAGQVCRGLNKLEWDQVDNQVFGGFLYFLIKQKMSSGV